MTHSFSRTFGAQDAENLAALKASQDPTFTAAVPSGAEHELTKKAWSFLHDITPPDAVIPAHARLTITLENWPTYDGSSG